MPPQDGQEVLPFDPVERLRDQAERADDAEVPWLDVIRDLLRLGRAAAAAVTTKRREEVELLLEWRDAMAEEIRVVVTQAGATGSLVAGDALREVTALLETALAAVGEASDARKVVAAHAVAVGLDRAVYQALRHFFQAENSRLIAEGEVYPVQSFDLVAPTQLIPKPFNTAPASVQDLAFDYTEHLRLGDYRASQYRFIVDWDAHDRLAELATVRELRLAACQPNRDLSEYRLVPEPTSEGFPEGGAIDDAFENHGPSDPDQGDVVQELVQLASAQGCQVVVVPEYALTVEQRRTVFKSLDEMTDPPILVIGGSARIDVGENTVNQACLWMPRGGRYPLTKVNPATVEGRTEDVDWAAREIRVFVTRRFTVAAVVCRDIMSQTIRRQLEDIGVTLLLVPAMAGRTRTLVDNACELVSATQAFVAVGNGPALWLNEEPDADRTQAAFHGPYGSPGGPTEVPPAAAALQGPGVVIFDVPNRTVSTLKA